MTRLAIATDVETPPFVRLRTSLADVSRTQLTALLPAAAISLLYRGAEFAILLAATLTIALLWEVAIAAMRKHTPTFQGTVTAVIVAIMLPGGIPLWQVGVCLSLGIFPVLLLLQASRAGFVSAGVITLALVLALFPGTVIGPDSASLAIAALPGALLLIVGGLVSVRMLGGILAGFALTALVLGAPASVIPAVAGVTFGIVFLSCDPLGTASTNAGRWIQGLLVGGAVAGIGLSAGANVTPSLLVFVTLAGSLMVPLIDRLVIFDNARRRKNRHAQG